MRRWRAASRATPVRLYRRRRSWCHPNGAIRYSTGAKIHREASGCHSGCVTQCADIPDGVGMRRLRAERSLRGRPIPGVSRHWLTRSALHRASAMRQSTMPSTDDFSFPVNIVTVIAESDSEALAAARTLDWVRRSPTQRDVGNCVDLFRSPPLVAQAQPFATRRTYSVAVPESVR